MDKILFLNEKDRNTGLSLEHSDYRYKTAKPVAATKPKHDEVGFTIPYAMFRPIREPGLLCELLGDNPVRRTADLKMNFDFLVKDLYENEISRLKYGEGAVFINKVVINNMDFEEAYNTAIQQKSIAQQNADKQKIENEAAIAKAEADKQVAITNAEAEAQKTSIAADAQAEANRKIAESLSDTLIEYQKIQKWDGKLPTVSGSNALVSIDPAE